MKKVLLIIALMLIGFNLKAEEPIIKFYLQDGASNQYNIEDIAEMAFVKSDIPYLLQVFTKDAEKYYDIAVITKISILKNDSLLIESSIGWTSKINIADIDSITFIPNLYNQVTIGNQTWMGRNLDVDHYRNGDPIPEVTDSIEWKNLKTGAWCYFKNDPGYGPTFGKLYNWYAVHDPRGLAPEGWHIPSDVEWSRLTYSLGGEKISGGKMKAVRPEWWRNPNEGATNESGFSGLPGGYRYKSGEYYFLGDVAYWWSSTSNNLTYAWFRSISYDAANVSRYDVDKELGFSVRCVKDLGSDIPTINSVSPLSGAIGDVITITGNAFGTYRGANCVSFNLVKLQPSDYQSWSDNEIIVKVPVGAETGSVSVTINSTKSNDVDFKVTGIQSSEYVTIGSQVWMTKNLNVDRYRNGDVIPQVTDSAQWANIKTGAWCYIYNNPSNGQKFGRLYNWYAVNDPRGLAPEGWHVATDTEWSILSNYLGGASLAGGKLKESGTTHWQSPNSGATNQSGFFALPGGYRYENKSFDGFTTNGYWWTASESNSTIAKAWFLTSFDSTLHNTVYFKRSGLSVRCVIGFYSNTPSIDLIDPDIAEIGDIITITGNSFGSPRGTSFVTFADINPRDVDYQSWSDNEIKVKVPPGAATGKVTVTVNGTVSNVYDFTVTNFSSPPRIISITPNKATIGDTITFMGQNFGAYQELSFVSFNFLRPNQSDYISWSDNEIKVKVPPGTSTGKVFVSVNLLPSNEVEFTLIYNIERGTVTDIDGNVYKTIKINGQWWMIENLRVTHFRNGNPIPLVTEDIYWKNQSSASWCYYKNKAANGPIYGKLYNWYAVSDARGIAPEGWHVATDAESTKLANYLGGESMAGGKLKSTGTVETGKGLWYDPNIGATDDIGFSALPGGTRTGNGAFVGLGYDGYWWRPASGSQSGAWCRSINNKSVEVFRIYDDKVAGYSVRCIKD
jgi:uncharacterized protein (TIGR02145 family)